MSERTKPETSLPKPILYLTLRGDLLRGGQVSLLRLLERLDRRRITPIVGVPHDGPLAQRLRELDIEVKVLGPWPQFLRTSLFRYIGFLWQLRSAIRNLKPNIIHVDVPRLAHLVALVKGRAKLLMHLRVMTPDGLSDALLAGESDAMIAISHGVADRFRRFRRHIRDKITIVYNGIDVERFKPLGKRERTAVRKQLSLAESQPLVTLLAAFDPIKRQEFALDIWEKVVEASDAHLVMAGGGDMALKARLQERIDSGELKGHVSLLDPTDKPEELLGAADVNLLTTVEEGFGRVIVESAACGMPSVASDSPGVRETILPGVTGVLLPASATAEEWAERILELLNDAARRKNLGEKARTFAVERFSLEEHVARVMNVYKLLGV